MEHNKYLFSQMPQQNYSAYRPEIDGLRTLAVFAVIFYHAKFELFAGGFIGVDIFFVISGFLITGIIIKDIAQNKFSFLEFYERRIRRIFPALYVLLLATFVAAYILLLPHDFSTYAKSLRWLLAFSSNIFFANTLDYFNPTGDLFPLLHTWSLSVEEQFYFIFPAALCLLYKFAKKLVLPFCIVAFFVTLYLAPILGFFSIEAKSSEQFFFIFFRIWELVAGALCAIVYNHKILIKARTIPVITNTFSFAGLLGIIYSFCYLDHSANPSTYAPISIISTCFVILFADTRQNTTVVGLILKNKIIVAFGLISYSLYLWHQPLFAFARIYFSTLSITMYWVLIIISCVLAYISYVFIERPFRNRKFLSRKTVYATCAVSTFALFAIATYSPDAQEKLQRSIYSEPYQQDLLTTSHDRHRYVWEKMYHFSETVIEPDKPLLLILGDSQGADFVNMIVEAKMFEGWQIKTLVYAAVCQINFDDDRFDFIDEKDWQWCKDKNFDISYVASLTEQADVLILASNWNRDWAVKRVASTIDKIKSHEKNAKKHRKIFLLGNKSREFAHSSYKLLNMSQDEFRNLKSAPNSVTARHNKRLREVQNEYTVIDIETIGIDEKTQMVPDVTPEGFVIFFDEAHLTQKGAEFMGKNLAEKSVLSEFASKKKP